MDRRGFIKGIGALVGGILLEEALPLNRVYSFPKEIKIVQKQDYYVSYWLTNTSAWFLEAPKPRLLLVHPAQYGTAKRILNGEL